MPETPVDLVIRVNKGIGAQIAKDLATLGLIALVGSRGLNNLEGTSTVEQGARGDVRLALISAHVPTGTFSDETARSRADPFSGARSIDVRIAGCGERG